MSSAKPALLRWRWWLFCSLPTPTPLSHHLSLLDNWQLWWCCEQIFCKETTYKRMGSFWLMVSEGSVPVVKIRGCGSVPGRVFYSICSHCGPGIREKKTQKRSMLNIQRPIPTNLLQLASIPFLRLHRPLNGSMSWEISNERMRIWGPFRSKPQ